MAINVNGDEINETSFTDGGDDFTEELEEITAASRYNQHNHHHHQQRGSTGTGCEVCGRGGGGLNSPVTTAPLAASGGGGGSGLITTPAPASWCLYCGCTQTGGSNLGPSQCNQCSPHRRAAHNLQQRQPSSEQHRGLNNRSGGREYYEAEDASSSRYQDVRNRSGQYYSPPGTSYTIVETSANNRTSNRTDVPLREIGFRPINRAASQSPPSNHPRHHRTTGYHSKQHPTTSSSTGISPEQVIRMLNSNHHHTKQHMRHETHPPQTNTTHTSNTTAAAAATTTAATTNNNLVSNLPVRTVSMVRPPDSHHGFGICVKGGRESGCGVYISRVEDNSIAEHVGLRPGDTILEVNGIPFSGVSHEEALKMLKSYRRITMTVRTTPGTSSSSTTLYTWTDRHGRPVSPPPEYSTSSTAHQHQTNSTAPPRQWNYCFARNKDHNRKVELSIEPGQSLGLMIRGGIEYGLGIFITGVDIGSVAERAGLMIGDQILEVNGQSFLAVTHDEAVSQLKYHKRMSVLVRDVGKVPSSGAGGPSSTSHSALHSGTWETHLPHHSSRSPLSWQPTTNAAVQMVQEKARIVLPHPEFASLEYYLREYASRQMDIEAFVAVLLEMLNTSEKYTLLTEIREVVRAEDRIRFDELVYRREAEGLKCRELRDLLGHQRINDHHTTIREHPSRCNHCHEAGVILSPKRIGDDIRSPTSEDSGVDVAAHCCWVPRIGGCESPSIQATRGGTCWMQHKAPTLRTSDLGLSTDEADLNQDYRSGGRRHSSPGAEDGPELIGSNMVGNASSNAQFDETNMELAQKLSRSFDMSGGDSEQQGLLLDNDGHNRRRQSMQRVPRACGDLPELAEDGMGAMVVPDMQGNLRITVKKTKPMLGIAIEGGANTKHPLPRIINIHENGAAFEAGGLEVGQLILEVDGNKVEGMQHQDVARLIAESFATRNRPEIEFLVVEAKKSNLESKPTALIFLEA